jgi:hypothetical protein
MGKRTVLAVVAAVIIIPIVHTAAGTSPAGPTDRATRYTTSRERILPEKPSAAVGVDTLSREQHLDLLRGVDRLQRNVAAAQPAGRSNGVAPLPMPDVREASEDSVQTESHTNGATPGALLLGRNNTYTNTSGSRSTVAEPAAANDGIDVFYTRNWNTGYSTNGGSTWINVPIPAGPSTAGQNAPSFCCDSDVIHDEARGITFWSALYTRPVPGTNPVQVYNGIVRLFVYTQIPGTGPGLAGAACSYLIDPDGGSADNVVPDYPHIGLSNDYLYLTTNETAGYPSNTWQAGRVRRIPLDSLADCAAISTNIFSYSSATVGQRVFVPVEGATTTMYWGALEGCTTVTGGKSCSSFRVYSWPETTTTVTSVLRSISSSIQTNPDCRGGTNNTDFIERFTAWSEQGFRIRGAVGAGNVSFWWNAAQNGASRPQAYARGAVFRASDLLLVSQPDIYNSGFCIAFPAVSANMRGDLGLAMAVGGKAGGGGNAVHGDVQIRDDFGNSSLVIVSSGYTHNPSDNRYGDYYTVHPNWPCGLYWDATSYSFNGGTAGSNTNLRYSEFGRARDWKCYTGWRGHIRTP